MNKNTYSHFSKTGIRQRSNALVQYCICLALLFSVINSSAQTDPSLPVVLPPTPEASSLVRESAFSAAKNSGAATAYIPFYKLDIKGFSLPIGLSYASSGVKIDAIPGRAGVDWSLDGIGVITRIVHGKPDDQSVRFSKPAMFGATPNEWLVRMFDRLTDRLDNLDAEPDEFQVAAPGLKAKFIIDSNGHVLQIPYSNLRIEVQGGPWHGGGLFSGFRVTNADGVVYVFGNDDIERTISHNLGKLNGFAGIRTGFYLQDIITPSGESLHFTYGNCLTHCYTGVNFFIKVPTMQNAGQTCQIPGSSFTGCEGMTGSFTTGDVSEINYMAKFLTGISSSRGTSVLFDYEERDDAGNDVRLKRVKISNGNAVIKSFRCNYSQYEASTSAYSHESGNFNKRFFLAAVREYSAGNPDVAGNYPKDSLQYLLEYYQPQDLPVRLSYSQDHWGYYNGSNNVNLLPKVAGVSGLYSPADRDPNAQTMHYGMLKKMVLPTGGYHEFIVEPNIVTVNEPATADITVSVDGSGNETSSYQVFQSSDTIRVHRAQSAIFSLEAFQNPGCPSCEPLPGNTTPFVRISLREITSGDIVFLYNERSYQQTEWQTQIEPGKSYVLKLEVKGLAHAASFSAKYDTSATAYVLRNRLGGGSRVKQINSYVPETGQTNHQFYRYTTDLHSTTSSAVNTYDINYVSLFENVQPPCVCVTNGPFSCKEIPFRCSYSVVSSSSLSASSLMLSDSRYLGYTKVIESNDENYANGATIHEYVAEPMVRSAQEYGNEMVNIPADTRYGLDGYETATAYVDSTGKLVRNIQYSYGQHYEIYQRIYSAITVNKRYNYDVLGVTTYSVLGDAFDAASYDYTTGWIRLDSVITTDYDAANNASVSSVFYQYGTIANVLPVSEITSDSKGNLISKQTIYPTELSAAPVYGKMVRRNMLSVPVEIVQARNGVQLGSVKNSYTDVFGDSSLFKSASVKYQRMISEANEERLSFQVYDHVGNILDVAKDGSERKSYLWDHASAYPVAEITQAAWQDVAYSSFEADGKGNWVYTNAGQTPSYGAMTGRKSYSLSSGNITSGSLNLDQTYLLSYWKRTDLGGVSVNVGGTGTPMTERNGWTLMQHVITHATAVTLSGSGVIDELRLYPQKAQMKTTTYDPLIGMTSQCDVNNRIIYYEYDDFGRLQTIRDQDRNIVKTFQYHYKRAQ
jgi:YD repeat-containing protein